MIDSFVLLTPLLLLGVALFGFVGCNWAFNLEETEPIHPPDPPANFHLVAGDNKVDVLWDIDPAATEYTVYRAEMTGTINDDYPVKTGLSLNQLPYIDNNVSNGKTYFYRVSVETADGESALSNEEQASPVSPFGSFVTGVVSGASSGTGRAVWAGMAIHIAGPGSITVQKLGRASSLGLTMPHRVRIIDAATNAELGVTSVDMNSPPGGVSNIFRYGDLASGVTLLAGNDYYIVSEEFNNGDAFFEYDTTVQGRAEAKVTSAIYSDVLGTTYVTAGMAGQTYGPVDFQY